MSKNDYKKGDSDKYPNQYKNIVLFIIAILCFYIFYKLDNSQSFQELLNKLYSANGRALGFYFIFIIVKFLILILGIVFIVIPLFTIVKELYNERVMRKNNDNH